MQSTDSLNSPIVVDVENVGGIDDTTVELDPGTTVLSGRNATNRTSFLRAIMAVHGSSDVSLKSDADSGHVRMTVGETTYERRLERENGRTVSSGTPILDDPEVADLFAFLLESNETRRAVERGDDLRELLLRPVDTDAIEATIEDRKAEREEIDRRLDDLDGLKRRLPELEAERSRIEDQLAEKRSELDRTRSELEDVDENVDAKRAVKADLEEALDDLWEARSDLEDVEYTIETERETVASLEADNENLRDELESLPEAPTARLRTLEANLDDLQDRKASITTDLNQLQNVVQFNEEMLAESSVEVPRRGDTEADTEGSITDKLVESSNTVVCWTCGSTVDEERISEVVGDLKTRRREKIRERNDVQDRIDEVVDEKKALESKRRERQNVERTLQEKERRIQQHNERIEELEAERESLDERIDELESTVESLRDEEQSTVLDLHQTVNQLEFDVQQLEAERAEVDEEIADVEDRLANREDLEARREEITDELTGLRTRVERMEEDAVDAFNTHMDSVLDQLGYTNVERVWIERTEREVREGRRTVTEGGFDLHIVRESDDGTAYEDTVGNLSESEREVIGIVFALAGYLVHDVHEDVPFMLLDSLEALDAERIADLVEYVGDYADNLVVALLPEDAAAIDDDYPKITDI